ncbi:YceI family protein [Flagellimonas alvinocaridis]|uniref:YceI family protein n=1 Tax=Flagellimonas alvinocaridis TaxID=2530200 RepID=A0A4S8RQL8_9FLAO|nr:YceI family protein [Allomuricauda alvinocaridis]THV57339.1 YceI family protein [Allomuricauda alvinocaridis]
MKKVLFIFSFLFVAQLATAQKFETKKNSSVSVKGTSSLHNWEGRVTKFEGDLTAEIVDEKVINITDFNFSFPVKSIRTGDDTMTKEMAEALKYKQFPVISYTFISVEFVDDYNAILTGYMTIAGVSKKVTTPVAVTTARGEITISGAKSMLMTDFGIQPPKIILGLYKAKNEISLHYFIHLKKSRK